MEQPNDQPHPQDRIAHLNVENQRLRRLAEDAISLHTSPPIMMVKLEPGETPPSTVHAEAKARAAREMLDELVKAIEALSFHGKPLDMWDTRLRNAMEAARA